MLNAFISNGSQIADMVLAAFISVFLTILFRGGPNSLYRNGKFSIHYLIWLISLQFVGSIAVYLLTFYFFCSSYLKEHIALREPVSFLIALMPVEITLVLLIVLVHRVWLFVIRKIDPNFEEKDPLDRIRHIRDFYDEAAEKYEKELKQCDESNSKTEEDTEHK